MLRELSDSFAFNIFAGRKNILRVMATIILSENNNQQHIDVAVNDIIQLQLDESPTTGYRWEITELNTGDIQIISEEFTLNADAGVGGGGKKIIQLKILRTGTGSIKLEYRRSWSGDVSKKIEVSYG